MDTGFRGEDISAAYKLRVPRVVSEPETQESQKKELTQRSCHDWATSGKSACAIRLRTVALPGSVKFSKPGTPVANGRAETNVELEVELPEIDAVDDALAVLLVAEAVDEARKDDESAGADKIVLLSTEKVEESEDALSELLRLAVLVGRLAVREKVPEAAIAIQAEGTLVGMMKADGSGRRELSVTVTVTGL